MSSNIVEINFHKGILMPTNKSSESVRECVTRILDDYYSDYFVDHEGDVMELFAEELSKDYLIINDTVYRINEAILSPRHIEATKQKDGSFSYLIAIPANGYTDKSDVLYKAVSDAK